MKLAIAITAVTAQVTTTNSTILGNAIVKNDCTQGSDKECERYGKWICCAHVKYVFRQDSLDFYSCATLSGIEFTNGNIYDA
jgi:hypothetical protein